MKRYLASHEVNPIGLGCMNLSHAYGMPPTPEVGRAVLKAAFDKGVRHFDTAALYGFGKNESLVGETLKPFRKEIFLASKCGMTGVDGVRVIDGRPATLKQTIDQSLSRLQTDHIDLYYLHRWDKSVPIEESVGTLGDMVRAGKIGAVGLSEVSAQTLRKAHREHLIAAVQTEYSLWTRNAELGVLGACQEIGAAFVAFSPLGRGFLANGVQNSRFVERDIRHAMPRFQYENLDHNLNVLRTFVQLSARYDLTPAQLSLAWVLSRGPHVHAIPGTTNIDHLMENMDFIPMPQQVLDEASALVNAETIQGARYPESIQVEIDTEEYL